MDVPKDVWLHSTFAIGEMRSTKIVTTAIDKSKYASLTVPEDPLLSMSGSAHSSPLSTPSVDMPPLSSRSEVPGLRSRFIVAGTNSGTIIIWDMRAPTSGKSSLVNKVHPLSIIHTDSPQISCLALTALYLIHGGNDGLVQAWDPLLSTDQPIRTLNSRFSSRARRRLLQAAAAPHGVGINLFAAGTICLDPDPTALRGVVSLGAHLRYWSFGVPGSDQYKRVKRRQRRSDRGSGQGTDRWTATGRGAIIERMAEEERDFREDERESRARRDRLQRRFGIGLLGQDATEDEVLAYATMLSEEAARSDADRRESQNAKDRNRLSSEAASPLLPAKVSADAAAADEFDTELAEAIRQSLEESSTVGVSSPSVRPSGSFAPESWAGSPERMRRSSAIEETEDADELEFAKRLSLAEAESRAETVANSPPF